MSIDQRLRNGLQPSGEDQGLDTLDALRRVEHRVHRRARAARVGVGALVAAVTVVVIGGATTLQRDGRTDNGQLAVDGSSTAGRQLEGTYVVDVADSRTRRQVGLVGRWVVTLAPNGDVELRPPPGYSGVTLGAAYRVEDDRLRTDALVEPGCQADNGYVGTYEWSFTGDTLRFTVVEDRCAARRTLFTGQSWDRVP